MNGIGTDRWDEGTETRTDEREGTGKAVAMFGRDRCDGTGTETRSGRDRRGHDQVRNGQEGIETIEQI